MESTTTTTQRKADSVVTIFAAGERFKFTEQRLRDVSYYFRALFNHDSVPRDLHLDDANPDAVACFHQWVHFGSITKFGGSELPWPLLVSLSIFVDRYYVDRLMRHTLDIMWRKMQEKQAIPMRQLDAIYSLLPAASPVRALVLDAVVFCADPAQLLRFVERPVAATGAPADFFDDVLRLMAPECKAKLWTERLRVLRTDDPEALLPAGKALYLPSDGVKIPQEQIDAVEARLAEKLPFGYSLAGKTDTWPAVDPLPQDDCLEGQKKLLDELRRLKTLQSDLLSCPSAFIHWAKFPRTETSDTSYMLFMMMGRYFDWPATVTVAKLDRLTFGNEK